MDDGEAMLRLRSLQIAGFKSFADPVQLLFPPGITVVVGPNGCGKSNISDAVGWVLGLQTARSLRGQRMDDFIFSGTRRRKAAGMAEVVITLEPEAGSSRLLEELGLPADEVTIARKLYRSGEGAYYLNGRRTRLSDLHNLLEQTGLGFTGYAMIAQGSIEEFLNSRPLDRRAVIEEAAQISGYKSRRRNAEMKLELAQQNLVRVNDIIVEVERQVRSLKRQAGKARQFKELQDEFRVVVRVRTRREAERLLVERHRLAEELEKASEAEREARRHLEEAEETARREQAAQQEAETALERLVERKAATELGLEKVQNTIFFSLQQTERLERELETAGVERQRLDESLRRVQEEIETYGRQTAELQQRSETLARELGELEQAENEIKRQVRNSDERLETLRQKLMNAAAETASLRNLRDQATQRERRLEAELERLLDERGRTQEHVSQAQREFEAKQSEAAALESQLRELDAAIAEKLSEVASLQAKVDEAATEENLLRDQVVALSERLHSIQELEAGRSTYSEGVKKALQYLTRSGSVAVSGTLADAIETEPRFERLVEEFLDEELEYILVENLEEGIRAVSEIRGLKSGKCAFLGLRSSNGFGRSFLAPGPAPEPQPEQGVFGPLVSLVRMQPEVREAFLRVHPDRAGAVVVSDLERALDLAHDYPESTFITLQGESLAPRGLVSGSTNGTNRLGVLALRRQRKELEQKVESRRKDHQQAVLRKEACSRRLGQAGEELEDEQRRRHQIEKDLLGLRHEIEQKDQDVRRLERRVANLDAETEQLEFELMDVRTQIDHASDRLRQVEREQEQTKVDVETLRQGQDDQQRRLHELHEQANRLRTERELFQERIASLQRSRERASQVRRDTEERLDRLSRKTAEDKARLEQLQRDLAEAREETQRLEQQREELKRTEQSARLLLEERRKLSVVTQNGLRALREEVSSLQERRNRIEIERTRIETQWENLDARCREQLHLALEELCVEPPPHEGIDEAALEERHEKLLHRLENFGPINMTALEEFDECQKRHDFLTRQREDIEKSIADTTRAIQDLNRRSLERFREAFEAVNRNFQEMFRRLFGGGDCGMTLLDEEDVLESGIDVFAQPPGKRLQNVMLLSGGEKTLTVLALLMGIFLYRPSRFCILDEVDAPLDEANVLRFTQVIREMSDRTQFLVITHNKRTMENAATIYGVTMEEPGVSKVLSVRM